MPHISDKPTERGPRSILNLAGARVPGTNLSHANLTHANLRGTDCRYVDFTGSNMKNAILVGTKLQGAILRDVKNLTWEQLESAHIDRSTILPDYMAHDRRNG